jgi:glycine hydroxymethyltransferase
MAHPAIEEYLNNTAIEDIDAGFLGYISSLAVVAENSPEVARSIVQELLDQRAYLKLIASENYCSIATQLAMGNLLTDKYAEGFPSHRFYAGCDNVDDIEALACAEACKLFGAEHAYVQPHSGADANMIAYWAILHTRIGTRFLEKFEGKKLPDLGREDWEAFRAEMGRQRLLGLDYYSGGHLTHGYRFNVSAQMFDCYSYSVSKNNGLLDYDEIEKQALEIKPLILLAGYSAYPRAINFRRMRAIADKVGAVLMVDMAHFCGLVAGGVFIGDENPVEFAHVLTTTTHKTLRGPRGGMILCKKEFAEQVDKGCPLIIGGPLAHVMAAKAVAFKEAASAEYKSYAARIVENSRALAQACVDEGMRVLTGGTDNHLLLIDVSEFGITGRQAEGAVRECGITLNRNSIPFDPNGAWFTSGLRIGTPAITTLGMGVAEMKEIAAILKLILSSTKASEITKGANAGTMSRGKYVVEDAASKEGSKRIAALLERFPVYPEIDADFLKQHYAE